MGGERTASVSLTSNPETQAMTDLAHEVLDGCRKGSPSEQALSQLIAGSLDADVGRSMAASAALFGILAEGLSDSFEPELCDAYSRLFSRVIAAGDDESSEDQLYERYQRVRRERDNDSVPTGVRTVFVLSRITLGADVAITSAIFDAAKRRFPGACVSFVGPQKNWELFSGDPDLEHLRVEYPKNADLRGRLSVWPELRSALSRDDAIVIDPDSRLTQLGLLPVCSEERYFFFESRSYGHESDESLHVLAPRWIRETFRVEARPYIRPGSARPVHPPTIRAASLGVGGNPKKRIREPFEAQLLQRLTRDNTPLFVDVGAGGEERKRVEDAVARSNPSAGNIRMCDGSFASFARLVERSRFYAGYDSAGQHVAAVCGVPSLTVFAGYPSQRMFSRWSAVSSAPAEIVRVVDTEPTRVIQDVEAALSNLGL